MNSLVGWTANASRSPEAAIVLKLPILVSAPVTVLMENSEIVPSSEFVMYRNSPFSGGKPLVGPHPASHNEMIRIGDRTTTTDLFAGLMNGSSSARTRIRIESSQSEHNIAPTYA